MLDGGFEGGEGGGRRRGAGLDNGLERGLEVSRTKVPAKEEMAIHRNFRPGEETAKRASAATAKVVEVVGDTLSILVNSLTPTDKTPPVKTDTIDTSVPQKEWLVGVKTNRYGTKDYSQALKWINPGAPLGPMQTTTDKDVTHNRPPREITDPLTGKKSYVVD